MALTCIINNVLSVVYNISLVESNILHLRKLNFTEALQQYLTSKDKDDHLTALATLACITDEKEAEIINSNRKVVKYLMKVLRRALRESDRRFAGWSCKELAVGKMYKQHMKMNPNLTSGYFNPKSMQTFGMHFGFIFMHPFDNNICNQTVQILIRHLDF